jgi:hypothetical protein
VINVVTTVGVGPTTVMVVLVRVVMGGLSPPGSLSSIATHCEYHSLWRLIVRVYVAISDQLLCLLDGVILAICASRTGGRTDIILSTT